MLIQKCIMFQSKDASSNLYSTRPNNGVILPANCLQVNVTSYSLPDDDEDDDDMTLLNHKLMSQCVSIGYLYDSDYSKIIYIFNYLLCIYIQL